MNFIYSLLLNDGFRILLAFLFSLILSLYGIPVLVRIADNHSMYDHPNGRTTQAVEGCWIRRFAPMQD